MTTAIEAKAKSSRRLGRSVLALLSGFVVNVALSAATDIALHVVGILPEMGRSMNNSQSLIALSYRTAYGIIGSYFVARLAPHKPMRHALTGAAIGIVLASAGAVATWDKGLSPHWYAVSLIALALPTGWAGAKLWSMTSR